MATVESLRTHLVEELADLLDAETQLTRGLPKMAGAATSRQLKQAFQKHLQETRMHVTRLKEAMRAMGETPTSKTCDGMKGLLEEGETMMNDTPAGALRDAVMITGAQKVEHYEMASYGTVRTYARVLGEAAVARLLQRTLNEEKAADAKLTQIAEGSVNEEAAEEWQAQDDEGLVSRTAGWAGDAAAVASRSVTKTVRRAAATFGLGRGRPQTSSRTRAPKSVSARRASKKR